MTRIGRCQIKTHNLLAMLPPGETNLAPLKIFQTKLRRSISVYQRRSALLSKWEYGCAYSNDP
jgi:hypothetical protein